MLRWVSSLVSLPNSPPWRGIILLTALDIGWGNLNGVMSSNVYREKDKPHYRLGHAIVLGYLAIGLLGGSILNYVLLERENGKRRRGERDHWVEGLDAKQIEALGDQRYGILSVPLRGAGGGIDNYEFFLGRISCTPCEKEIKGGGVFFLEKLCDRQ